MFAAQAGLLSLGPVLPDVAHEFGVSAAAAGQVRTLGGLAGGAAAVAVAVLGSRLGLRGMLIAGHLMLALGTLASAVAPNLAALAAAQAAVGAAAGLLIAGALAASAAWGANPADGPARSRSHRSGSPWPGWPACHSAVCSPNSTGAIRCSACRWRRRSRAWPRSRA